MFYVSHWAITTRIDEERGARTYRHGAEDGASTTDRTATVHARPLSRERSKSKPTSQPIVNTGTTGEFNSIRTRSSDCSIVRHRIPPTRSCGLFPLYLSLPPFPILACNPQRLPLSASYASTRAHTFVDRNAHRISPVPLSPLSIYLSNFILRVLQQPGYIRGARKVPYLKLHRVFLRNPRVFG